MNHFQTFLPQTIIFFDPNNLPSGSSMTGTQPNFFMSHRLKTKHKHFYTSCFLLQPGPLLVTYKYLLNK